MPGMLAYFGAFDRNPHNLAVAKEDGADHIISIKGKSSADVAKELSKATGQIRPLAALHALALQCHKLTFSFVIHLPAVLPHPS